MPKIRKIINNLDDVTTEIVSESIWIDHLIKSSAITTMNDDSLIQSLSQLYVLFHSANTLKTQTTLHSIQLDKYAVFNVDDILRPTESLETAIQGIFHQSDTSIRWALLLSLWDKFGYFWPRKIILGYKNHLCQSFRNTSDFYHVLNSLKDQQLKAAKVHRVLSLDDCTIIARLDLTPLHDFFPEPYKSMINEMIQSKYIQISVSQSIKLYNIATNSYLCWDYTPSKHNDPYLIRAIPADHLKDVDQKHYLWKLSYTPTSVTSIPLRGSTKVYIQPAHQLPQQVTLSCKPTEYDAMTPQQLHFSRIKALRLLPMDHDTYQYEKLTWLLDYPNNHLKYITDYQLNIKLNINEHIKRIKPLLEGDTIQLQQIGLLTAFYPIEKPVDLSSDKVPKLSTKKSRNNVLCIDEDIIRERYANNTIWKIQLATVSSSTANMQLSNLKMIKREHLIPDNIGSRTSFYTDSQSIRTPTRGGLLRRTQSFSSFDSVSSSLRTSSHYTDKAPYFESLVTSKLTTKLVSQFVRKVTLEPIAQLVKPHRAKDKRISPF
ncbi:hypothetical protein BCV71DRAFT_246797 [Rhizopus microsporus]|nr:hypothetical protein BCV71DRAFT_246797 [Rhizopus microsporus]